VVCALGTAFFVQATTSAIFFSKTQRLVGIVRDVEYTFLPPLLTCVTLLMLLAEHLSCLKPVFVHIAASGVGADSGRPVHSFILLEWLVNVPILLILAGNLALNRPLREVLRPLAVTNSYMVIAWAAYFVPIEGIRWLFIAVSFSLYVWASYDMATWVAVFRATARPDMPARNLRCFLTIALIVIFFLYGMVYLASVMGILSAHSELIFVLTFNFATKLLFTIAFAGIRASQFNDLLVALVRMKVLPINQLSTGDVEALEAEGCELPVVD